MSRLKKLGWGRTPWDSMTHEELLREMQRAYAAVTAAGSVLALAKHSDPSSPFWGSRGSGFLALEKCRAVVERVESKFTSESVYRSFFRYAVDLLFTPELGNRWGICPNGDMFGPRPDVCSICKMPIRAIKWADLDPSKAEL